MILSFFNFIWIFICAFLTGFASCQLLIRLRILPENLLTLDIILFTGLTVLTAGAQWFSLVYRVGIIANISLLTILIVILVLFFKKIKDYWFALVSGHNIYKYLLLIGCLTLFFSFVAATMPEVTDTALYHNQAIQWIEKYGVVKGLGNLHFRLAYNSSFFALQALFSWTSIVGQSLHGMNSFIAILFTSYSLIRLFRFQKTAADSEHLYIEQLLNLFMLYYIYASISSISSPSTDFLPMLLILYIFSKWASNQQLLPVLFLFGLFGITVKLSIVPIVLIGLPLLFRLVSQHRYKQLLYYVLLGCYLVFPFLIRNIIISGYLFYPVAGLDFFPVDWKMPSETVIRDNHEIIAWGRRLNDVNKYEWPLTQWFPIWFAELSFDQKILFSLQVISLPFLFFLILKYTIRKHLFSSIPYMLSVSIIFLLYWFFSAPLVRYGMVFLYLIPLVSIGYVLERLLTRSTALTVFSKILIILGCILCTLMPTDILQNREVIRIYNPSDYNSFKCLSVEIAPGVSLYYPTEGQMTGYDTFPSLPYPDTLDILELRGDDLKDGFRIKSEIEK